MGCGTPLQPQKLPQYRTCTMGHRVKNCPVMYYYANGDIEGSGYQQVQVPSIQACADQCNVNAKVCCGIKFSQSDKLCIMFKKCKINGRQFNDYQVCIMPPDPSKGWSG